MHLRHIVVAGINAVPSRLSTLTAAPAELWPRNGSVLGHESITYQRDLPSYVYSIPLATPFSFTLQFRWWSAAMLNGLRFVFPPHAASEFAVVISHAGWLENHANLDSSFDLRRLGRQRFSLSKTQPGLKDTT